MDKGNIMEFAGLFLNKHKYMTSIQLQRFIMNRNEVGKAISIEEIDDALSSLYYARFINVAGSVSGSILYEKDKA